MFDPAFIALLQESVGPERSAVVLDALEKDASVSIRLNPAKLRECPFPDAERIPWSPYAYILKERPSFIMDPLMHAGCYYVQDSSAMFPGEVFRRVLDGFGEGVQVLDLCAAPGGKTTDLSASLRERFGDRFRLIANEVVRKRFQVLRSNVETWGGERTAVVNLDPSQFGVPNLFDIILADVPCSGEGMFRKDAVAREEWSPANVEFCASRQRKILADIWPSLRSGGILIYSTCTFNHLENDDNLEWAARELGASIVDIGPVPEGIIKSRSGYSLLPGFVPGEGQWAGVLRKDGELSAVPAPDAARILRAEFPAASAPDLPMVDVDRPTALAYLHGEAIRLQGAPIGLINICFQGHPLGTSKNIGSRCNNLFPKERRIRKDV